MMETLVLEPEVETQVVPQITAVQIVDRMLEILAKPGSWCKSSTAQDRFGYSISDTSSRFAVRFCVGGALQKATGEFWIDYLHPAAATVSLAMTDASRRRRMVMDSDYVYFNDCPETTHADVLSMLREVREAVR